MICVMKLTTNPMSTAAAALVDHGNPCVVGTAVQSVGDPAEAQRSDDAEQQRVADAAVEGQVVEFAEEILAEDVHVRNGPGNSPPDHGAVANATPQHHLSHGGPQHNLRQ